MCPILLLLISLLEAYWRREVRGGHSFGETRGNVSSILVEPYLLAWKQPAWLNWRRFGTHHASFRRLRVRNCLRSGRAAVEISDDVAGVRKGRIGRGHAGVDCQLHQDLFQLAARKAALGQSSAGV